MGKNISIRLYATFKVNERLVYLLPNTSKDHIIRFVPKTCRQTMDLADFKIRNLKGGFNRRPEWKMNPVTFYNTQHVNNSAKYPRRRAIQIELLKNAFDLLNLDGQKNLVVLDAGCGNGIGSESISEMGHFCIGVDISPHVLKICQEKTIKYMDCIQCDISQGLPLLKDRIDGCISVATIQWLLTGKDSRLICRFYKALADCLIRNGLAVIQFYPYGQKDVETMLNEAAVHFYGALLCDYPHQNNAKKLFLLLVNKHT